MTRALALPLLPLALAFAGPCAADRSAPAAISADELHGPGLDAFRAAVMRCWNTGNLSAQALQSRVTLRASFDAQGHPDAPSIRLVGAQGAPEAAEELFQSARRALIRCGATGLPMPAALRDAGRQAEMTFDPAGAALR